MQGQAMTPLALTKCEWRRNYSNLWRGNREVHLEYGQCYPYALYWYRLLSALNPSEGEGEQP